MIQPASSSANHVFILRNPKAGATSSRAKVEQLIRVLVDDGREVTLFEDPAELSTATRQAMASEDLRVVICAGGDGTLTLAANTLPPDTPLTVFPFGTENLLAKNYKIKQSIKQMQSIVARGKLATIDAGEANGQLFLIMLSCGFDAEAVSRLHGSRKGHINHWSYAKPILSTMRDYAFPTISVRTTNGQTERAEELSCNWAFIFNLPRYASGLRIAPNANDRDGKLDITTFRCGSLLPALFQLGTVLGNCHGEWSGALQFQLTEVTLASDQPNVPFQMLP